MKIKSLLFVLALASVTASAATLFTYVGFEDTLWKFFRLRLQRHNRYRRRRDHAPDWWHLQQPDRGNRQPG